jgi:hypothetical protein
MSDQQHNRVTARIAAGLEKGVRARLKPWDAGHRAEGRPAMLTREQAHTAFGFLERLALTLAAYFAVYFAARWLLVQVLSEPCCHFTDNLPARIARLERRYEPPDPPRPPAPPRQAKR